MSKSTPMKVADNTGVQIATPMDILNNAIMGGADVETLERLLAMQERWEANQAKKAYYSAMANLRPDLPQVLKTESADFGGDSAKFKYEDLATIVADIDPIMAEHGLHKTWDTDTISQPGFVIVSCVISHRDGYSKITTLSNKPDATGKKNALHALGSTITYLQRLTLKAALGLAAGRDTNGNTSFDNTAASDTQIATIQKLIDEFEVDIPRFCKFMGVEAVKDIPARDFTKAVNNLERKRVQK